MNAPSVDIKDLLNGESSLGLTFATDLFIGREPSNPDNCVTIFDTPGREPEMTLKGKDEPGYFYPLVQIRVRNNAYVDGWNEIEGIKNFLNGMHEITQGGAVYDLIKCVQEPSFLDWDKHKRVRFVATFRMHRKEEG